ncbi:uncharacterized protein G2W53_041089 [Senna tora]|uniref:Uncharacterized protein n=1 Tax=Senna tora TaxID=362788 RepID=A0A834VXP5_9FABA|nr:uncharacterized protein G2W53_041089 [Senna tora]
MIRNGDGVSLGAFSEMSGYSCNPTELEAEIQRPGMEVVAQDMGSVDLNVEGVAKEEGNGQYEESRREARIDLDS